MSNALLGNAVAADLAACLRLIQRFEDTEAASRRAAMEAEGRSAAEIDAAIVRWRASVAAATERSVDTLAAQAIHGLTDGRGLN